MTLILMFSGITSVFTQAQEVEHNYLVGPQLTNCDSLEIDDFSLGKAIEKIRGAKYRFDQKFRLTRKSGLQKGEFYSCDNQRGYLIITMDNEEFLFVSVDKSFWNELISSSDPEGFYLNSKSTLQIWNRPIDKK